MSSIDKLSAQGVSRAYVQSADAAQTTAGVQPNAGKVHYRPPSHQADSVSLSDGARSFAAARDAVQRAPDVNEQKVADIRQRIDTGTYEVSSRVLAQKMIRTN